MILCTSRCIYLFYLEFYSDKCPGMGLLYHIATLFVVFWGISILFCIVVAPVYISTSTGGVLSFLHILFSICHLGTSEWWPFWLIWGDISLQFWIAFLLWLEISTTLLCHHCLNCVTRTFWSIQQKAGLFQCKATEDSDTLLSFLFMTKYGLSVNILGIQVFHTTWSFTNHNGKQHEPL